MSKIYIQEVDETTADLVEMLTTDIAYVPGFSSKTPTDEEEYGLPRVPKLCSTVAEFERYFGALTPTFKSDQQYPSNFDLLAIPTDIDGTAKNMFNKDDPDPSYIYAKELIGKGIPVLYERMNGINEDISVDSMYSALSTAYSMEPECDVTDIVDTSYRIHIIPSIEGEVATIGHIYLVPTGTSSQWSVYQGGIDQGEPSFIAKGTTTNGTVQGIQVEELSASDTLKFYNNFYGSGAYKFIYKLIFNAEIGNHTSTIHPALSSLESWKSSYTESFGSVTTFNYFVENLVSDFSDSSTYAVGDFCKHADNFYICRTAVAVAGDWADDNWSIISRPSESISEGWVRESLLNTSDLISTPSMYNIYGIKFAVSDIFTLNDTFSVNSSSSAGWECNGKYIIPESTEDVITLLLKYGIHLSLTEYNDQISYSLQENDYFVIYLNVEECKLLDKGEYSIKYITSGGYPTFEYMGKSISEQMAKLAYSRGDCIALIDHTDNPARALTGKNSVYFAASQKKQNVLTAQYQSYAAMFTPCVDVVLANFYRGWSEKEQYNVLLPGHVVLPPSFAYLSCLASSIRTNANWISIAGATRGKVTGLVAPRTEKSLTNAIADSYQPDNAIAINPITNVKPYGQCIWGNRTLVDNSVKGGTTATSFLNIRNLANDIKKQLYIACQSLLFEQNTDVLWVNFLALITPLLDKMKTGSGIDNYKIVKLQGSDKTHIKVKVRIYPVYAVESFDITLYINDKGTYLEEEM